MQTTRWYDFFSHFYDASLRGLYDEDRQAASDALDIRSDSVVLDVPCGTGQSFPYLVGWLGDAGLLLGVDGSAGMLKKARRRADSLRSSNIALIQQDVAELDFEALTGAAVGRRFDRLHLFLGLSCFPNWEAVFEQLWQGLAPMGRCVIVDVHNAKPGFQGWMTELVSRGQLHREVWRRLEQQSINFQRVDLPYHWKHGGQIYLASGDKQG